MTRRRSKTCRKCGEPMSGANLGRRLTRNGAMTRFCKACHRAHSREWRRKHPERAAAARKAWYQAIKDAGQWDTYRTKTREARRVKDRVRRQEAQG